MDGKRTIKDLAVFGGTPAFSERLHVGCPNIGDRTAFLKRVNDVLDRKWLTNNGVYVQEFEQKLATFLGVKHCVSVANATLGLEIAARALGLSGEVIVPSFTFVASAHALEWQRIVPVFCDVDPGSHNLDPARIEELITPRTTGILGVHTWGRSCAIKEIDRIARKHGLKVFYDAAHAFGCTYQGKRHGAFGDAEVFSFHATKFMNSFEGGAITTNNDALAKDLRLMRNFGFSGMDTVVSLGVNGKMSEVSAAMGLTNLESLDLFVEVNRRNYEAYQSRFRNVAGFELVSYSPEEFSNYQYVVTEIDSDKSMLSRDDYFKILHAENVSARRYFAPGCHNMEPYASRDSRLGQRLPQTERLCKSLLAFPTGTSINEQQIETIAQIVEFSIRNATELGRRLSDIPLYLS